MKNVLYFRISRDLSSGFGSNAAMERGVANSNDKSAAACGKPVLLRIDDDAGHGIGSTKKQRNEENADIYAFLFQQLGAASQ